MGIPFVRDFDPRYGEAVRLSPRVTRVVARNPGPFTFTGSGTYLVGDASGVAVIDPGPSDAGHADAVLAAAAGPITHLLVTHTHRDHCGNVEALRAATGAPALAYAAHPSGPEDAPPALDEGADHGFAPDTPLRDGEVVTLPGATLRAVHTPGHIANHLCFLLEEEAALFTGDHVMGWATTVVAPPDGEMSAYMASLDAVTALAPRVLYPTHGAPITDPLPFVAAVRAHREARDAAILAALADGPLAPLAVVDRVYDALDPALRPAAALNVRAHLNEHVATGRVRVAGETYALAEPI